MYNCPKCKTDVPDNMYHWCGTTEAVYYPLLERIAKQLERIADKLEGKIENTSNL